MIWPADGQDGNGIQFEKNSTIFFFKFIALCLKKLAKTLVTVYSHLEKKSFDVSLSVL